jgi:iron complex transport system substrate-binding protein
MRFQYQEDTMKTLAVLLFVFALMGTVSAQNANLTDSCVESYDPSVDYFPEKATIEYAENLTIEYFNHYKRVTVEAPYVGSAPVVYLLVQCGTPAPEDVEADAVFEIPAQTAVAMSTTQLPHFAELGLVDRLVGLDSFLYVNTPEVLERIDAGEMIEVGGGSSGTTINVELVLDAEPDIVLTYAYGDPQGDAHPALISAGVPTALNGDWLENSPLGRAEWIKFTAAFFNKEGEAETFFGEIAANYTELAELTAAIEEKPLILWNSYTSYGDAWFIAGAQSYSGQLMRDAGGVQVLGDEPQVLETSAGVPFSFEAVYEAGLDAPVWFPVAFAINTVDDLIAQDERYADFAAVQNGGVYNNDARVNVNGGNDYFESAVLRPDVVLADLISILHPELLPDHELVYFRQLS